MPRRNHPRRPLTDADRAWNRSPARRRVLVEHGIRRLRVYQALVRRVRKHRQGHERRVAAVAGLVNRGSAGLLTRRLHEGRGVRVFRPTVSAFS